MNLMTMPELETAKGWKKGRGSYDHDDVVPSSSDDEDDNGHGKDAEAGYGHYAKPSDGAYGHYGKDTEAGYGHYGRDAEHRYTEGGEGHDAARAMGGMAGEAGYGHYGKDAEAQSMRVRAAMAMMPSDDSSNPTPSTMPRDDSFIPSSASAARRSMRSTSSMRSIPPPAAREAEFIDLSSGANPAEGASPLHAAFAEFNMAKASGHQLRAAAAEEHLADAARVAGRPAIETLRASYRARGDTSSPAFVKLSDMLEDV
jgi:hypothetical protein